MRRPADGPRRARRRRGSGPWRGSRRFCGGRAARRRRGGPAAPPSPERRLAAVAAASWGGAARRGASRAGAGPPGGNYYPCYPFYRKQPTDETPLQATPLPAPSPTTLAARPQTPAAARCVAPRTAFYARGWRQSPVGSATSGVSESPRLRVISPPPPALRTLAPTFAGCGRLPGRNLARDESHPPRPAPPAQRPCVRPWRVRARGPRRCLRSCSSPLPPLRPLPRGGSPPRLAPAPVAAAS
jgi:hypothetical protein